MIYDFHILPIDKYMFSIGSLRAEHLTKKLAWVAGICQILKIYCGVARGDGNT